MPWPRPPWGAGSPDGSTIAFWWETSFGSDMYLADANGSNLRRVPATDEGVDGPIAWSPDGQWLAFEDNGAGGQVVVTRLDGSDRHRIADVSNLVTGPGLSGPNSNLRDQTSDPSWAGH